MVEMPLAALERILKKSGAKRISIKATQEYAKMLEEHVREISSRAAVYAEHAGRNTVLEKDILLAKKSRR
jgi:histone H3/H4